MTLATATEPILLDLDEKTWERQIDRTVSWLGNVLVVQAEFRKLSETTAATIKEPHIKKYLEEVAARAQVHEDQARQMFRAIGREPSKGRSLAGTVLSKAREAVGDVVGLVGGARGSWKDLRQLLLVSQDALGAFAIVEQLGYALALPELAGPAFQIVAEKTKHQLLIQEYMLEMGPVAILYHEDV